VQNLYLEVISLTENKLLSGKNTRQFISYIFVGGTATVVEWGLFWIFVYSFKFDQNTGFIMAYIVSTLVNMIMGKMFTFKNSSVVNKSKSNTANIVKETVLIYLVAAIGCLLNVAFLNFFTIVLHMDSMLSKVWTTAIIFIGNYLARKLGIYKENKPKVIAEG
jgi:putative flippase GtrA